MSETEEVIGVFTTWLPLYLIARKRFMQARLQWGSYTLKTDTIASEYIQVKKGYLERLRQIKDSLNTREGLEKYDELERELRAENSKYDQQMIAVRRDYVTTLLPLYKAVKEFYEHISPHIKDFVEVFDEVRLNYTRFPQGEPKWHDHLLEYASRLESEGRLEEKLSVWP